MDTSPADDWKNIDPAFPHAFQCEAHRVICMDKGIDSIASNQVAKLMPIGRSSIEITPVNDPDDKIPVPDWP